jgi:AcrR family transcriptional regulator
LKQQVSETAPRKPAARERILAAARKDFFAHGFRGVTMDDLAASLGMSKKTLYAHFPSKKNLLEALLVDKFQRIEGDLQAVMPKRDAGVLDALHQLLATIQRHAAEIQPPFLRDIQRDAPDLFHLVERRRQYFLENYFGELLGRGRKTGAIRKDVPVKLIIEILLAAVNAIVNPARLQELGLTPQTAIPAIVNVVLEGAIAKRGKSPR